MVAHSENYIPLILLARVFGQMFWREGIARLIALQNSALHELTVRYTGVVSAVIQSCRGHVSCFVFFISSVRDVCLCGSRKPTRLVVAPRKGSKIEATFIIFNTTHAEWACHAHSACPNRSHNASFAGHLAYCTCIHDSPWASER